MIKVLATLAPLTLIASTLGSDLTRGDDAQAQTTEPSVWMKQKLSASQNILAGLTKGDYEAIEKNAQSMLAVGYLEKWIRANTPGYRERMKEFEYANKALTLAARDKNVDGATIAYAQLTFSCVNCHKIVRGDAR
jgi:hypothetical protein